MPLIACQNLPLGYDGSACFSKRRKNICEATRAEDSRWKGRRERDA